MDYKEYRPPKEVSHLIECFWTNTLHPEDFRQDYDYIIPDGSAHAIFMLNGNYLREDEKNDIKYLVEQCSFVTPFQHAVKVYQKPHTKCFVIRFKPEAIQALTGASLGELDQPVYPLEEIMPDLADITMEQILRKTSAPNIINVLIQWLKRKQIHKSTLEKNFKQTTGYTPKEYAQVIRFNFLLNRLLFSSKNLTETTYEMGYFDQSHMIRDFRKITGITPTDFIEKQFAVPKLAAMAIENKNAYR